MPIASLVEAVAMLHQQVASRQRYSFFLVTSKILITIVNLFQDCLVVVGYVKDPNSDGYLFEAEARPLDGNVEGKWVGIGLSLDGGRGMGNDAVVACYHGIDGVINVVNYWNQLEPFPFSLPVEVIN